MSKLYFKYGVMNSGKSMFLLATVHNLKQRNVPHLLLKSGVDNRDGNNTVTSRALGSEECIPIFLTTNIYDSVSEIVLYNDLMLQPKLKWILIDEAQFLLASHVDQLARIVDDLDINVICYGLKTDFKGELFNGSKRLFEIADSFEEIKSTCSCGKKNIFNARIDNNGNITTSGTQIMLGKEDIYLSMCRSCYFKQIQNYFD